MKLAEVVDSDSVLEESSAGLVADVEVASTDEVVSTDGAVPMDGVLLIDGAPIDGVSPMEEVASADGVVSDSGDAGAPIPVGEAEIDVALLSIVEGVPTVELISVEPSVLNGAGLVAGIVEVVSSGVLASPPCAASVAPVASAVSVLEDKSGAAGLMEDKSVTAGSAAGLVDSVAEAKSAAT